MKITYVIQRFGREVVGGGETFCRSFATRLAARGHQVSVVTGCALDYAEWDDHYPEGTEEMDGVTVHRLPTHAKIDRYVRTALGGMAYATPKGPIELHYAWLRAQGPLLHTLDAWLTARKRDIDVLVPVTQYYFPADEAILVAKREGIPTLFHPLAHEDPSLDMALFDKIFPAVTAFGFLTEEEEALVRNRFGVRQPGLVHGVGVDLEPEVDRAAADALALPPGPFLCYVGRCDEHKIGDAIDYVREFRARRGKRIDLVIVGTPQPWLKAQPGVHLAGYLPDPVRNAVLERSLGLVMPSPFESFSMVLTESWAMRRPALVNGDCGPLRGQAERSQGAVSYRSYTDFEAGVLRLLDEPGAADTMGANGRAYVERRYDWDHVMDTYEDILDRVARPGARTPKPRSAAPRPVPAGPAPARPVSARTSSPRSGDRRPHDGAGRVAAGPVRVRWEGALLRHHSLSEVNRQLVSRLADAPGLRVEAGPQREGADLVPRGSLARVAGAASSRPSAAVQVTVRHQWPPDLTACDGALALIQPWEFGCVPQEWVDALDRVDEFWVPSEWVRRCYLASGVPADRVVTIPNAVDTARFVPDGARYALPTTKTTKLLFVGGTITRKGIDALLCAYVEAFRAHDDVCLVVKGYGTGGVYSGSSIRGIVDAIATAPDAPEILYLDAELDPAQMASLYRACDVLVHPYRGEGFGLPVAEAMACGLPVIVSAGGPTDEFCPPDAVYRVPAVPTTIAPGAMGLPPAGGPMWWLEPDGAALAATLRHVVRAPAERAEVAARGMAAAAALSWERSTEAVAARVAHLAAGPSVRSGAVPLVERPVHPGSPQGRRQADGVGVLVALGDDPGRALDLLEQLEGTTLDGAPFHVLVDASGASPASLDLLARLDGVSVAATPTDPCDPRELAELLLANGYAHVVRLEPGVRLQPGWWSVLSDALTSCGPVRVLGAAGSVTAIGAAALAARTEGSLDGVWAAVDFRPVPDALVERADGAGTDGRRQPAFTAVGSSVG